MKRYSTCFLFLVIGLFASFAQQETQKPTLMKPVYFDISPPLRDLVKLEASSPDNSWKEGVVMNKLNTFTNEGMTGDNQAPDPVHQFTFGNRTSDTTIQNFDGVSANGSWPPDTDGDAGLSHYMQVVNCRFAVYDKNGTLLMGPNNSNTIFIGLPHNTNDGDAILLYDENADRWLFSQFGIPNYPNGPFYENVAISQTNDPTGTWYRYQYTYSVMPDYPKLAVWGDGYYMTIRRFASGSGNWLGPAAVAMDRTKMLAGDPTAGMVMFNLPSTSEGPQAADCDSDFPPAGTPCPVAYLTSTPTATVTLYDFHVDWGTPANSTFTLASTIEISPFSYFTYGSFISQKNTSQKLDAMSGKRIMFRMPFRKFNDHWSMLLNTTVKVSNIAGIRWMELRNVSGVWSLYQEGTYSPDANHRWMGSIAMDASGNIALGYSISSSAMFPSIRYTGRLNGDPPGVMTLAEKGIINGSGSQTSSDGRWGDYSAMAADPAENGKFWYTQEYYAATSSTNWNTRVGSFRLGSAIPPATTTIQNVTIPSGQTNCYNASQTITVAGNGTTFSIQNGGRATLIAGQNIDFSTGTTVSQGGYLWGKIAPSGPFCTIPSIPSVLMHDETTFVDSYHSNLKLYPNPTTGKFILEYTGEIQTEKVNVDIFGLQGELVLTAVLNGERTHEFSLSDKAPGIYFLRVIIGSTIETGKISKH
jgi:hypothetical protein